jgi:hypothetical protein
MSFRIPVGLFCAEAEELSAVADDDASSPTKFATSACDGLLLLEPLLLELLPQPIFNTHESASKLVTTILLFISI